MPRPAIVPNQGMVAEIIKLAMIRVHAGLQEEGMANGTYPWPLWSLGFRSTRTPDLGYTVPC